MPRRGVRSLAAIMVALSLGAVGSPAVGQGSAVEYTDIDYTPSETGYWLLRADGTVETSGTAPLAGGARAREGERFTDLLPTGTGLGYWLTTGNGHVVDVGDAADVVDLTELACPHPRACPWLYAEIVGAAAAPSGMGVWLVGADGQVYALGDAAYHGSIHDLQDHGGPLEGRQLAQPITGLASSPTGGGYWMVAADGGVFGFGDAGFFGSVPGVLAPGTNLDAPITDLLPQGGGYMLLAVDGGIFAFGQSVFRGSLGGQGLRDIVAATVKADRSGYLVLRSNGAVHTFGTSTAEG